MTKLNTFVTAQTPQEANITARFLFDIRCNVVSTWHYAERGTDGLPYARQQQLASRAFEEISRANLLINIVGSEDTTGVEYGYIGFAIASKIPVISMGVRSNLIMYSKGVHTVHDFTQLRELINAFQK